MRSSASQVSVQNEAQSVQYEIRDVSKSYGDTAVLHAVSLQIRSGEFLALLGPSGSGKSTTLRILAGLEALDGGEVLFDDRPVANSAYTLPPNLRDIGLVFQSYALWPHLNVLENVMYPLRARGAAKPSAAKHARAALEMVELGAYERRNVSELSGGQQQRVALARAISPNPRLVLFDEPLSNLDSELRETLRQKIAELHKELSFSAVYVTHDYTEAFSLASRVALFRDGRIVRTASPGALLKEPGSIGVASAIGFNNVFNATVVRTSDDGIAALELHDLGVTGSVGEGASVRADVGADGALEGDEVYVCMRSSSIRLVAAGEAHLYAHQQDLVVRGFVLDDLAFKDSVYVCRGRADGVEIIVSAHFLDWGLGADAEAALRSSALAVVLDFRQGSVVPKRGRPAALAVG